MVPILLMIHLLAPAFQAFVDELLRLIYPDRIFMYTDEVLGDALGYDVRLLRFDRYSYDSSHEGVVHRQDVAVPFLVSPQFVTRSR